MMEPLVTILTPTYNRGYCLDKLYLSLTSQTNKNFEWLVIDDGSTDDTEAVISDFILENKINIRYYKKNNGGKHTALNYGINMIESKLIFIVDSDDWLINTAIDVINEYYVKYSSKKICGFSFLRAFPDGKINVSFGRNDDYVASYNKVRIYENRIGDMAEVYFTEILKKYPFPIFDGENFLSEDIVWIQIGKEFDLVFVNKAIYVSDYLSDGLTKNRRRININNPIGAYNRALKMLSVKMKLRNKAKSVVQLIVYGKFAKIKNIMIFKQCNKKILFSLLFLPACILFSRWKKGEINNG